MADISQVKEITAKLEQGVKDIFNSDTYADYLKTMSRFHRYSTRNTILIHMQRPNATHVAGFRSWQTKFGRNVKKGEKSIKILAPAPFTVREEKEKFDPDTKMPVLDDNGMPIIELTERHFARFKVTSVFDVEQTDGKPLPSLVQDLTGNVEQYTAFMDALRAVSPLPIVIEPLPPDTDGTCHYGDKITIREGMSEIQTVCAVIHEITHAKLHDISLIVVEDETAKPKDLRTKEVEAESVSYAVCQYFGIETGANSFGYLADWSKTRDLKELNASLDIIRKTAADLIDEIDSKFQEIVKERDITFAIGEEKTEGQDLAQEVQETLRFFIDEDMKNHGELSADTLEAIAVQGYEYRDGRLEYVLPTEKPDAAPTTATEMPLADILNNREEMIRRIIEDTLKHDPEFPVRALEGMKEDYRAAPMEKLREAYFFYFPNDPPAIEQETPSVAEPPPEAEPTVAEQLAAPEPHPILAEYARAKNDLLVGATVLMTPLFEDGNYNRSGKKIRVKVEKPAGKYQLFSREEHGEAALYFMTASGRLDRTSQYFDREWNEQQREWVHHHPTEAELDAVIPQIAEQFERDMADPAKWAMYQHAAVVNRLDDCEAHNVPVRAAQEARRQAEDKERDERERAIRQGHVDDFNASVDELADTLVKNEKAVIEIDRYMDKNPLFVLFNRYEVDLQLATKGWVNRNLKAVQVKADGTVSVWIKKGAKNSETFAHAVRKLTAAIAVSRDTARDTAALTTATPDITSEADRFLEDIGGIGNLFGAPTPPPKERINTMEHELYNKFAALFPDVANFKYSYLRLESDSFEPLSIERLGGGRISLMHTYTLNGDLCYDPMMSFAVDSEAQTMTPAEFEQSIPPLYQRVDKDGSGQSIDGNGNEQHIRNLREKLNEFADKWLDNIAEQEFMPIEANLLLEDDEEIPITFDKDGNPIMPEPEPTPDNSTERKLYERFLEIFPQFMNQEYSNLRLEAQYAKPLALEWVFGDCVSIAHIYEKGGKPAVEPMVMLTVNSAEKTMTASSFDTTDPPRHDVVKRNDAPPDLAMQQNINNLTEQWLDRIEKQRFMPVQATLWNDGKIDTVDVKVTFDKDGKPILPKAQPDRQPGYENRSEPPTAEDLAQPSVPSDNIDDYLTRNESDFHIGHDPDGNGISVWNWLDLQPDGNCKELAHINMDREITYLADNLPKGVIDDIEAIAKYSSLTLSAAEEVNAVSDYGEAKQEIMPDPSIGMSEMNLYGYNGDGVMLPLLQGRAVELFDADQAIYLLYPDNTEAMALDRDEILKFDGIFGIENDDWERSPILAAQLSVAKTAEGSREADLLYGDVNKFGIYQLKHGDETRDYRFEPLDRLHSNGLEVERKNYELVYTALLADGEMLDGIYERFNINRPDDFTGHSLSVSDIVVLQRDGKVSSHYVDSIGFVGMFDFLGEERRQPQAVAPEQANSQVGNTPTVAELEADAKAGKAISISDLSKAVNTERGNQSQAPRPKTTLMARLDKYKQKAAAQGQPDPSKPTNREV